MSSMNQRHAFILSGSLFLVSLMITDQAAAQQRGDVQIKPATQSVLQSLDNLEQLLLAPPEEENRLNVYIIPQYRRDRYEDYSEQGQSFSTAGIFEPERPIEIDSPDFSVDSTGISVGADYLLDGQWLFGGQLSYTNADFDYDVKPDSDFLLPAPDRSLIGDLVFGDPIDREFDEYGLSFSAGYLAEPWTVLATIGYSSRKTDLETLKIATFDKDDNSAEELQVVEADFDSDIYSADLGASYRINYGDMSLQPYASVGYQIEDVDGYSEEVVSARDRDGGDIFLPQDLADSNFLAAADVKGQTIRSIPARIGVLSSTPLTILEKATNELGHAGAWRLRAGLSFTHDFDDQKRLIRGRRRQEGFSATYEEKNRNRNFFSLTAGLGFDFAAVNGSLNYQHDIGLDERKSADVLSLQLRVPLPY